MNFAIVEFTDDSSVGVVPTNWLNDNDCRWPTSRYEKLARQRAEPGSDWLSFRMRVLHKYGMITSNLLFD